MVQNELQVYIPSEGRSVHAISSLALTLPLLLALLSSSLSCLPFPQPPSPACNRNMNYKSHLNKDLVSLLHSLAGGAWAASVWGAVQLVSGGGESVCNSG